MTSAEDFATAIQDMHAVQREMAHLLCQTVGPGFTTVKWDVRFERAKKAACEAYAQIEDRVPRGWN